MDKRWRRALLLQCNKSFLSDISEVRKILGIPPTGFDNRDQGEEYAKLLDYRRNGVLIPLDPITGQPQVTLPPTNETYELRSPSPLMLKWGIGKFTKVGGSPKFPTENFDEISTEPLDQHVFSLIIRYGLPDTDNIKQSIRNFILTADANEINFDSPVVQGITNMSVSGFIGDEEFVVTLEGVSPDITKKDWEALYPRLQKAMRQKKTYRKPRQFEFHKFMYQRIKIDNLPTAKAEIEWMEASGEDINVGNTAYSQAFRELEELMKPIEK